jgi:hypothetical protein
VKWFPQSIAFGLKLDDQLFYLLEHALVQDLLMEFGFPQRYSHLPAVVRLAKLRIAQAAL